MRISKQYTNRESESLDIYLAEIGKVDLLNSEMEIALTKKIKEDAPDSQRALEFWSRRIFDSSFPSRSNIRIRASRLAI